jgi:hypothetical protein
MARRRRGSDCGSLLEFEEVRRRLQLGTRVDVGVQEIPIDQIIGSMGRAHEFDGCFRPRSDRLRRVLVQIQAARPNAADTAIAVYQVDHAYFVVDGHKRLALAVEEGREVIDADVGRFASRFHVAGGTTMQEIRVTEREDHFRQETGLDQAVPDVRFPLGDVDGYLDLEESVKAHAYDLSQQERRVVPPVEAARHWYETVYRAAVRIARDAGIARLLDTSTEPELFLMIRSGSHGPMSPDWQVRPEFVESTVDRLREAEPRGISSALSRVTRRRRPRTDILPSGDVHSHDADPDAGRD